MELIILIVIGVLNLIGLICLAFMQSKKRNISIDSSAIIAEQKKQLDMYFEINKKQLENMLVMFQQLNNSQLDLLKAYNINVTNSVDNVQKMQEKELQDISLKIVNLTSTNELKMDKLTDSVRQNLDKMLVSNENKLEQMRVTVDEKLNASLERRLNESFALISQRLEAVSVGLGEMKNLASGVGDLKKVLTNVKTRGTFGEVQLGNLLEQMLSPNQFASQVQIGQSSDRVDFVVYLPGKDDKEVMLPIDAKFPMEDYIRLQESEENNNLEEIEQAKKALERRVKDEAKKIKEKYISIPDTTEFAIMYLATEGLYSEVLKRNGLMEQLQRDYRVVVCGPTTISALLNSLQMGFKTLAIEKQSAEIWNTMSVFKKEFEIFVELLAKTQKKIDEAGSTIESATKKSLKIQKQLNKFTGIETSNEQVNLLDENKSD